MERPLTPAWMASFLSGCTAASDSTGTRVFFVLFQGKGTHCLVDGQGKPLARETKKNQPFG